MLYSSQIWIKYYIFIQLSEYAGLYIYVYVIYITWTMVSYNGKSL